MQINIFKVLFLSTLTALLITVAIIPDQNYIYLTYGQKNSIYSNIPKSIDGIKCDKIEHLVFHNHTKLQININNESYKVPAMIGIIPGSCIFWLHTHDDSGFIHIESPINQAFNLNQFFQIWKEFKNSTILNSIINDSKLPITAIVDGKLLNSNHLNLNDIKLKDKASIILNITKSL